MDRIFLGKFSNQYPEQIEKKFYSAGDEGGVWYGGVKVGDYVFPSYEGHIIGLWRAKAYIQMQNNINPNSDWVLQFEEVKTYKDVSVTNDFTRYKYFEHDLNLVNKVTKSVKNLGFIPIKTRDGCPKPEDIDFKSSIISIYVALDVAKIDYKNGDIRILIDNSDDMRISKIERFVDGSFIIYESLNHLYQERTSAEEKYSIRELYDYAGKDNSPKKRKFLAELIERLDKDGYFKISDAIKLYDNLLVGRKVSIPAGNKEDKAGKVKTPKPGDQDLPVGPEVIIEDEIYAKMASLLNFNPNMILYGPPGTGKTYATKNIINAFERQYFGASFKYDQAYQDNRVRHITFHQSYSYEEFIEGIRPVLIDDEEKSVAYRLENGVFKDFCTNASKEQIRQHENLPYIDRINSDSIIWKLSLGERKSDTLYNECMKSNEIAIGWLYDIDLSEMDYDAIMEKLSSDSKEGEKPTHAASTVSSFVSSMKIGDIVMVYNSPETVRQIGIVTSEYYHVNAKDFTHRRKVEWIHDLDYPIDIKKYNSGKILTLKTLYRLSNMTVSDIVNIINEKSLTEKKSPEISRIKPYYMVIDEINRGNIARVFGELITLIEMDKRGMDTILPYSKKPFRVPANLYLIGTMNTADRSIAVLDTALRRRFTFVEIEPDSSIIAQNDNNPIVNDQVNLSNLLTQLNDRIMERFDRDHRIGHAYFMEIDTLQSLYQTWYYKILPLLNEYFYNDVAAVTSIVGSGFFDANGNIRYLDTKPSINGRSDFEDRLISIYSEPTTRG
jgi:5-methylcytosine-specific restriction protein B